MPNAHPVSKQTLLNPILGIQVSKRHFYIMPCQFPSELGRKVPGNESVPNNWSDGAMDPVDPGGNDNDDEHWAIHSNNRAIDSADPVRVNWWRWSGRAHIHHPLGGRAFIKSAVPHSPNKRTHPKGRGGKDSCFVVVSCVPSKRASMFAQAASTAQPRLSCSGTLIHQLIATPRS